MSSDNNHVSLSAAWQVGWAEWWLEMELLYHKLSVWPHETVYTHNNWHIWQYRHTWHMTPVVLVFTAVFRCVSVMAYITRSEQGKAPVRREHMLFPFQHRPVWYMSWVLLVTSVNCVSLSCVSIVLRLSSLMYVNSSLSHVSSVTCIKCQGGQKSVCNTIIIVFFL